jgi:hypothetical protein
MTQAVAIQIADVIKDLLSAADLSQTFTVRRMLIPVYDISTMRGVYVTVVPRTRTGEWQTRGAVSEDYEIDIAVQKKLTTSNHETEIEELLYLTQEIDDYLRSNSPLSMNAQWISSEQTELYMIDHILKQVFTGFITATYKVIRA